MSRFDNIDADQIASTARDADDETTAERDKLVGGAPPLRSENPATVVPITPKPPKAKSKPVKADEPASEKMSFPIRVAFTFTEDDPVGRALAERLRAMPEAGRKHYATNKVVRDVILDTLEPLAKKI
jgi:hypothetical protein